MSFYDVVCVATMKHVYLFIRVIIVVVCVSAKKNFYTML